MSHLNILTRFFLLLIFIQGSYLATASFTPIDTACMEEHVYFKYNLDNKLYKDAAENFRILLADCPYLYESMYVNGEKLYKAMLKGEESDSRKSQLIDTILLIQRLRSEQFGKRGYLKGKEGVLLMQYRPKEFERAYTLLDESVATEEFKSTAQVLNVYFTVTVKMAKAGKLEVADVLDQFEKIMEITKEHVEINPNPKLKPRYLKLRRNLLIIAKPYLTKEKVVPWKEATYPLYMDSIAWLQRSLQTLYKSQAQNEAITGTIAEKLHELSPSAISAFSLSNKALIKGRYNEAMKYLKQAVSLSGSDSATIIYYFKMSEVKRIEKQYEVARTYLRKVLELDPKNAKAYELLGSIYSDFANRSGLDEFERGTIYWRAVDMYQKAISLDAPNANDLRAKIVRLEGNFPPNNIIFFHSLQKGDTYLLEYWIKEKTKVRPRRTGTE